MTKLKKLFFIAQLLSIPLLSTTPEKRQALYCGLDPTSISQHLAFYELYCDTNEGRKALVDAWKLISSHSPDQLAPLSFPQNIDAFIALINPDGKTNETLEIPKETLASIEQVSAHLPNRKLKGYTAETIDEVLALPSEEIELSRALLLSDPTNQPKMRSYLATLDLMALQVLVRLPKEAGPVDKIRALNQLIFHEMGFRFPPHSSYSQQIDQFTFLPAVLESRKGVCLGVSTLYLCLAQRIDLCLEIITPPGHIYLRAKIDGDDLNIETTLRGVHVQSDEYLSINTCELQICPIKEVIGMAYFNQASVWLAKNEWQKAASCYERALPFTPNDRTTKMLYGCSLLLCDRQKEAMAILKQAQFIPQKYAVSPDVLVEDILEGNVDKEALKPLFLYVDETRASILKKKEALEISCSRCSRFRSGLFQLAISYLQLQQPLQAIQILEKYHLLDSSDISVEFYLAELYLSRFDSKACLTHFNQAESIALRKGYMPVILQQFKAHIAKKCLQVGNSR